MTTATMTTLEADYSAFKDLIYYLANKFFRSYGGEFDEIESEANYAFVLACQSHDPNRGSLSTWAHSCIWGRLRSARYLKIRESQRLVDYKDEIHSPEQGAVSYFMMDLRNIVSENAREVVDLVLDMPEDVAQMSIERGRGPSTVRRSLYKYLTKQVGWSERQVRGTFDEIREALKS
jgi:hypothetical protein